MIEIIREDPEGLCSAVISLMQRRQPSSKVKGVNKVGFRVYQVHSLSPVSAVKTVNSLNNPELILPIWGLFYTILGL